MFSRIAQPTLVLLLSSVSALAQDASHPLRLKQAIQIANDHHPLIAETSERINQAKSQVPLTRSLLFPNLSLIGTASEQKDALGNGGTSTAKFNGEPYNAYQAKLHLTQTLFAFGTFDGLDGVKKGIDQSRLDLEIAQRNLDTQIIQAYYAVVLDMRSVDVLRRQEKIEREALGTSQSRSRTGRGQLLDVLQIKTQLALLQTQIANADNQLQIDAATLANLLGDQRSHEYHVRNELEAPALPVVDAEVNLKNFHLPELEKNKVAIQQIEDQKKIQLGTNLPTLNATADYIYGANKQADVFNDDSRSWIVSLNLVIPIFSGLSSRYQQQILSSQRTQLEFDRQYIQNAANLQQVASRKKLETAAQSIVEGEETLRLATSSSNEARRMYRYATIDFLNFLNVEQAYVTAEASLNAYKYNYIVALAAYYVGSGQDLNHLVDLLEKVNP